jgi:hypothetical protein
MHNPGASRRGIECAHRLVTRRSGRQKKRIAMPTAALKRAKALASLVDVFSSPKPAGYVRIARLNVDIIESYESPVVNCLRVCV